MIGPVERAVHRETVPLVAASGACVVVAVGFTNGIWWSNIHNGILGVVVAFVALVAGLVIAGSARPGLVVVSLIPVVAGWSALHGHVLARYRALSWLTDAHHGRGALPTALARTTAEALDAPGATVWMGDQSILHPVGVWPGTDDDLAPCSLEALPSRTWPVRSAGKVVGALVVPGVSVLAHSEQRMMQDLCAQAALVLDRLTLPEVVQRERAAGHLEHLTPREREVLELMARGLSNAAICQELHLSVKTVEPLISTIFAKLGLHSDPTLNRRVLAALEYHRG